MRLFFSFLIILAPMFLKAEAWSVESGNRQVSLIELYSSEGCSSCPPADRWISGLVSHPKLFKEFVPVAFQVDYWNYLGWVDPYSNESFSRRQRKYASEWRSKRVYTPGFVKNGFEWRRKSMSQLLGEKVGNLKVSRSSTGEFQVSFDSPSKKNLVINAVLMGHELKSKVRSGENAGETLNHEFVVLKQVQSHLVKSDKGFVAKLTLPQSKKATKFSVAFWVSERGSQKPLQSVGRFL